MVERRRVRVRGTVQGVGFRPFVYREAVALGLRGYVRNDSAGVVLEIQGRPECVAELCRRLTDSPPPLARVEAVEATTLPPTALPSEFVILASDGEGEPNAPVSVDTATCDDCLGELDDPSDRRFGYPFTNCTNCGPRYTIVTAVPYDRPATTMAGFVMCPACQAEYDDPADRRFHAQPNACAACGPAIRFTGGATATEGPAALAAAVDALAHGAVLAVKGLGGYHLAVDAADAVAVATLRRRKQRDDKPFAVMVADLETARLLVVLDEGGERVLSSPRRPIVVAPRRPGAAVSPEVAPGLGELGVMLPYTPLHHLLLRRLARPLVLTSGNRSDEPIAHRDDEAVARLGPLVDGIVSHDRPIHIRCDDSVVRAGPGAVQVLRRSRGYAPEPLPLPFEARRAVLAVGAELKSTVSLARQRSLIASHHLGDLEHLPAYEAFLQATGHLARLYAVQPEVVVHDLHPDYLSTKYAVELDLPVLGVQHHHAHVASCLVDHGRVGPALGVAFDGHGYGPDATLWGGEFLWADLDRYERLGHLVTVGLPGGAAAIREPWRMAQAWATHAAGPEVGRATGARFDDRAAAVAGLLERPTTIPTSSVGRLFDAAAALLCGRGRVSFEGQAAIELEALAAAVTIDPRRGATGGVEVRWEGDQLVLDPAELILDLLAAEPGPEAAARFHDALGHATAVAAALLAGRHGLGVVALTGGVFQNARLTQIVAGALRERDLEVLVHRQVPPNDGGISIGQAAIGAHRPSI